MIRFLKRLRRSSRGSTIIEFAFAAPVIFALIFGFIQFGIMFLANSGLQRAVDEGARHATIFPTPSDAEILAKVSDAKFGLKPERITGPTLTSGTDGSFNYVELTMSYAQPMDFVLFEGPTVNLTRTRRAYLP